MFATAPPHPHLRDRLRAARLRPRRRARRRERAPQTSAALAQERYYSVVRTARCDGDASAALAQERYHSTYGQPEPLHVTQTAGDADDTPWLQIALSIGLVLVIGAAGAALGRRLASAAAPPPSRPCARLAREAGARSIQPNHQPEADMRTFRRPNSHRDPPPAPHRADDMVSAKSRETAELRWGPAASTPPSRRRLRAPASVLGCVALARVACPPIEETACPPRTRLMSPSETMRSARSSCAWRDLIRRVT